MAEDMLVGSRFVRLHAAARRFGGGGGTGGCSPLSMGEGTLPPSGTPISARLGGGEALWPTLLAASWGPWRPISAPGTP